ncbi:MAG: aquaporin [Opitutales bacterium]|nr:aquaporin [Opitutales bacterium]MCH8539252.1 aquaporin [Opitutales bacterium]
MPKYTIEFIGTYFLVLSLILVSVFDQGGGLGPFAVGLVLLAMTLSGGHISGGHFNPAITLAALFHKKISLSEGGWYFGVQFAGALGGAFTAMAMNPREKDLVEAMSFNFDAQAIPMILGEFAFTLALVWVFLVPLLTSNAHRKLWQGLVIAGLYAGGLTVVGEDLVAAFNPAAIAGFVVSGKLAVSTALLYMFVQFLAALTVALSIEHIFSMEEKKPDDPEINPDHL